MGESVKRATLPAMVFTFLLGFNTDAQDDDAAQKAGKVKAAFLYNFIKFVEWPEDRSPALTHKAHICIMGEDPFGAALNTLKSTLSGKIDLSISNSVSAGAIRDCTVLYIARGAEAGLTEVLSEARHSHVLTVSEIQDFADSGGIIEMKTVQKTVGLFSSNKINLRINLNVAEATSLKISPQLLEIAAEVIK